MTERKNTDFEFTFSMLPPGPVGSLTDGEGSTGPKKKKEYQSNEENYRKKTEVTISSEEFRVSYNQQSSGRQNEHR